MNGECNNEHIAWTYEYNNHLHSTALILPFRWKQLDPVFQQSKSKALKLWSLVLWFTTQRISTNEERLVTAEIDLKIYNGSNSLERFVCGRGWMKSSCSSHWNRDSNCQALPFLSGSFYWLELSYILCLNAKELGNCILAAGSEKGNVGLPWQSSG